jgi:large subunit ribosomal protein L30e
MGDINKALQVAVRTGKITLGLKESLEALRGGKAKLIILAKNFPSETEKTVNYYSQLLNIPLLKYNGSSGDLGTVCGKPFKVSIVSIRELGDSAILSMVKTSK